MTPKRPRGVWQAARLAVFRHPAMSRVMERSTVAG